MKISKVDFHSDDTNDMDVVDDIIDDIIDEIEAEGTIYISHQWIPIETSVQVYKISKSGKAYYGNVIVYECDNTGRVDTLFEKESWKIGRASCRERV